MPKLILPSERILGIDYGSKRIGLAVGDSREKIALPFGVIKGRGRESALKEICEVCRKEGIDRIVVGLPLGLSGRKTPQTSEAEKFSERLAKSAGLPVAAEDERMTTKAAEKLMKGDRTKEKDPVAAMAILQSYFDKFQRQSD